jgi:hypothetical protein
METTKKIRISSNLILMKILGGILTFYFLKLLFENRNTEIDFKTITEYKLYLIASILFLLYFLTRPIVSHDDITLYIKRVNNKQKIIILKKITSIYVSYIGGRGTSNNSIEYLNEDNSVEKIRFNCSSSDKLSNFINLVKKNNPRVEII